jgi:hypothetical protein
MCKQHGCIFLLCFSNSPPPPTINPFQCTKLLNMRRKCGPIFAACSLPGFFFFIPVLFYFPSMRRRGAEADGRTKWVKRTLPVGRSTA